VRQQVWPVEYRGTEKGRMAIVSFLSASSGRRQIDNSDIDAIKTLVSLPNYDTGQIERWLDAYFRDVT
jgi:hypothetical protein